MPKTVNVTMLNAMAGREFPRALDQLAAWHVKVLDLKDGLFGKGLADLSDAEAQEAARLIRDRGFSVYCFSTVLFHPEVERGEDAFRRGELGGLERVLQLATVLRPKVIRLLSAQTARRAEFPDCMAYLKREQPWLIPMYGEAIDRIAAAGFEAAIENEIAKTIFSKPAEVRGFFAALDRPGRVHFIWDVQNFWEMGTFPSLEVYGELKELIGALHLKGGRHDGQSRALKWASALEDASWPVLDITRRAVADGVAQVICLNPSHGQRQEGYDYSRVTERDLEFVRRNVPGVE